MRQLGLDDEAVPVLHQCVSHVAELRRLAFALAEQARVRIGDGCMRRIRPGLAAPVALDVAADTFVGGLGRLHRTVLRLSIIGAARRYRRAVALVRRRPTIRRRLKPETLERGPRLDQCAIDGEMIVRQQRRDLLVRQDCREKFARNVGIQQPVAVLREHRRNPHRIVDAEPHEPAEKQIVLKLLHQLALGADREQDLHKARPQQPFGRDRRTAFASIKPVEIGIEHDKSCVHHLTDFAQRMSRRNPLVEVHIAEQRAVLVVRSAHAPSLLPRPHVESYSRCRVDWRVFQRPASPRFSPWMTTSGLRIRESCFTRTTSPEAEQAPDADTL